MSVKNISSSNSGAAGIAKSKESESTKGSLLQAIGDQGTKQSPPGVLGQTNKNFGVELSDRAKARSTEQKKSMDIAKSTPDIREDKVSEIKARIQAGTYEIDSGKIADGMLREAIMDHLATQKDR